MLESSSIPAVSTPGKPGCSPPWIGYPILCSFVAFCFAFLVKIEGLICLLMAAPVFAVMSSLGALTFWFLSRRMDKRKLSFSIAANTAEIPPTTMDEHMIVGGDYFNVLRGTYEIEDLGGGRCRLKLSSNHVATTRVNIYADLWGRILMQDIQDRILKVIRKRCEGGVTGA